MPEEKDDESASGESPPELFGIAKSARQGEHEGFKKASNWRALQRNTAYLLNKAMPMRFKRKITWINNASRHCNCLARRWRFLRRPTRLLRCS